MFVFVCLLLWSLAGCGRQESGVVPAQTAPASFPAGKTEATAPGRLFRAELQPLSQPDRYRVALAWERLPPRSEHWVLQRKGKDGALRTLWRFEGDTLAIADDTVEAGHTYDYVLSLIEDGTWHRLDQAEVRVPRDVTVQAVVEAPPKIEARRIFFRPGGILLIGERAVEISADEIFGEGGVIETFREGATAAAGRDGRSGGTLRIRARTGSGLLPVSLRGENGGAGLRGLPGPTGAAGERGAPARLRMVNEALLRKLTHVFIPTFPGQAPFEQILPPPPPENPAWKGIYACETPAGAGAPGAVGGTGQPGTPGGRGGDSGSAEVTLDEISALDVPVRLVPGTGGVGEGGPGGARGPSGPAGANDPHGICPPPAPAAEVPGQGPRGESRAASNGRRGTFCLQKKGTRFGDCSLSAPDK